jgi:dipeptide/tripeptide permease
MSVIVLPFHVPATMRDLLENISRFPKFFILIILGVFANLLQPLGPLMQRPITAIALIGLLIGSLTFVTLTLRAMLDLGPI